MIKTQLTVLVIVALGVSTSAFAQYSASGFNPSNGGGPESFSTYVHDDGGSENSLGLTNGGNVIYLNQYTVTAGDEIVDGVAFAVGNFGAGINGGLVGTSATVHIWDDAGNDLDPNTSSLLESATCTIAGADDDVFTKCAVAPTNVGAAGDSFFVGVQLSNAAGEFPAAIDTTSSAGSSWIVGDTAAIIDPLNLAGAGLPPTSIDAIGFAGNFMVRANAVPEPASMGLIGMAFLALGAMRRK